MRILIDGIVYSNAPSGGVFNYFNEIIPRLGKIEGNTIEVFLPNESEVPAISEGVHINRSTLPSGKWFPNGPAKRFLGSVKRKIEATMNAGLAKKDAETVFHTTGTTPPPWKGIPSIATIHDMISEMFDEYSHLDHVKAISLEKKRAVEFSNRLIAVSECTKRDLCRVFDISPSRVDVIHHGVDHALFSRVRSEDEKSKLKSKYRLDKPFILYVGGRLHHKNFERFAEAFAMSDLKKEVLLGLAGFPLEEAEIQNLKRLGIWQNVRPMTYPPVEELATLYQMAEQFVLPSLYEGFGMSLVEAMAAGCPITASNTGPFPELTAGAALLFDPKDPSDIARKMEAMMDLKLQNQYKTAGHQRALDFSWDKSAEQHLETYRKAVHPDQNGLK